MTDDLAKPLHLDDVHAALLRAVDALQPRHRVRGEDQMTMTMEFDAGAMHVATLLQMPHKLAECLDKSARFAAQQLAS